MAGKTTITITEMDDGYFDIVAKSSPEGPDNHTIEVSNMIRDFLMKNSDFAEHEVKSGDGPEDIFD